MKHFYCLLLCIFWLNAVSAQSPLKWDYTCKPGTDCWNALTSVEERQTACQIKGIDLNTLSTEELLLITMEHPFFRSYVAHDSPVEGLTFALEGFNGLSEFKRRSDAMQILREVYFRENFSKLESMPDSVQVAAYSLKWIGVELIMSDERLLSQMSRDEQVDFLKRLHGQLLIKQRYRDVFGGISDVTTASIFCKVMKSLNVEIFENAINPQNIDLLRNRLIIHDIKELETLLLKFNEFVRDN
jgi:hypothetical protein